ncbi:MAG: hypothetical protein JSS04_00885 [Proteobacteria bacterium]|nr:hypothetical protein [Pseudomonadota bacterium]
MGKWQPIASAPFDRDLQLSVIEEGEVHALAFPCRRTGSGWFNSEGERVEVNPSHWRDWAEMGDG